MSTAKEELQKIPVAEWTKNTVADGIYLNKNTIKPLVNRDEALANKIDNDILPVINDQNNRITNAETRINDAVNKVTNITDKVDNNDKRITSLEEWKPVVDDTLEEHDIHLSAIDEINNEFQSEINDLHNEDTSIWTELDKMQAASDVVQVFGSYHEFQEASATMSSWITDQDIVKVLHDEHDDADQVYYRYYSAGNIYENIGSLSPYYSVTEIDALFTSLSATVDSEIETINENIETAVENLNGKITAEQERAEAKESELATKLDTEISDRTTADTNLQKNIDTEAKTRGDKDKELSDKIDGINENFEEQLNAEIERATQKEEDLDKAISDEKSRAEGKEAELAKSITDETARATKAETDLTTALADETKSRSDADESLNTKIDTVNTELDNEIERATNAEQEIQNQIDGLDDNVQQQIEALQQKDSELSESIGTVETTLTAKINSEETRATTKENELDTKIDNLENNLIFNPELPLAFSGENGPNKKLVINYDSDIFSMNEKNEFIINIITTKEINDLN